MKKIAFTLYVVGIIVVLPLVAVLQLNRGLDTFPNVKKISIPANEKVTFEDDTFSSASNFLTLKSNFN